MYSKLSIFSSIRFSVSGFMWRSLIHLNLSFVQGNKNGSICILLHAELQLNQHHLSPSKKDQSTYTLVFLFLELHVVCGLYLDYSKFWGEFIPCVFFCDWVASLGIFSSSIHLPKNLMNSLFLKAEK